jgi:hypothetical protein
LEQRGGRLAWERRKATGRSVAPFSQNVEGREGVGVRLAWPSGGEDEGGPVARASEEGGPATGNGAPLMEATAGRVTRHEQGRWKGGSGCGKENGPSPRSAVPFSYLFKKFKRFELIGSKEILPILQKIQIKYWFIGN